MTTNHAKWICLQCRSIVLDAWKPCPCGGNECLPKRFVIHGRMVSQKNDKRIMRVRGRPFLGSSSEVKEWHASANVELIAQAMQHKTFALGGKGRRLLTILFGFAASSQAIDSDNLSSAPLDALQKAGIIKNDYWCSPLIVFREQDPANPRVEIYLAPFKGSFAAAVEAAVSMTASPTAKGEEL